MSSMCSRDGILAKEKSLTGIQNDDDDDGDTCSRKTIMTCDDGGDGAGSWSDLTHHVLFLVMMQLGVIDFVAFSGVCKSWRAFALSYMNTFMASMPPMLMFPDEGKNDEDWCCHLKDAEGRKCKTVVPHSSGSICVGVTCGYVILYECKTCNFRLVNLITRHELHFPDATLDLNYFTLSLRVVAILVFSPSISGGSWVFVVLPECTPTIWFSIGDGEWSHVSSTVPMEHLHFFKGKIYTLHAYDPSDDEMMFIGVMKLDLTESELTLLEIKNFPSCTRVDLVCSGENLYLLQESTFLCSKPEFKPHKLDFGEMKWVMLDENTSQEYAFFLCYSSQGAVVKPESWWQQEFRMSRFEDLCGNERFFPTDDMWYFPHEYRYIYRMDE